MNLSRLCRRMVAGAAICSVAACGNVSTGGGITGSGLVVGPISRFGSIFVNNIEIDVSQARVTLDGLPAGVSDLRLGMIVQVRGIVDLEAGTGIAATVDFSDQAEGPVDSVDAANGKFTVLGQTVVVDSSTVFDGVSLASLAVGSVVEISGHRDAGGRIRSTRVEAKSGVSEFELKGTIRGLEPQNQRFALGESLIIDYSSARIEGASSGGLRDGMFVEVKTKRPISGGVMAADEIQVKNESLGGRAGEEAEIEGFVTRIVAADEFVVNDAQTVRLTDQTRFEGGTRADLLVDSRIEAKGQFDDLGALLADKIEFDD